MGSEWPVVRLGDVADCVLGKMLDSKKNRGELRLYLSNKDVRWGSFDLHDLQMMRFESDESERYGIRFGDLIICEGGEPGRCAIWKDQIPGMMIQKALHRVRPQSALDNFYLFYWFRLQGKRGHLDPYFTGTTIKHLPKQALVELKLDLPPLPIQRRIADILGSLDDKIELNRRMNATLEDMARTLFKSWFVDFDPVRAKMVGRQPQGMNAETAALFPDGFEDSELGEVPRGWGVKRIDDMCEINSLSLSKFDDLKTIDYVEISEVSRGEISNIVTYARGEEPSRARRRLRHGDTVLSTVRPDRGAYFLSLNPPINRIASTGFAVVSPQSVPWSFVHVALTSTEVFEHLGHLADGGAYPAVRPDVIGAIEYAIPENERILDAFHMICAPLFAQSEANRNQNRTLAKLRDTLLPKLMGGEVVSVRGGV